MVADYRILRIKKTPPERGVHFEGVQLCRHGDPLPIGAGQI